MANISIVDFDQNKSDKCRVKSIKGFFRYTDAREAPERSVKELVPEIASGVYLDFIVRYFWCGENGNDCYLEIGWEPAYLDGTVRKRYEADLSEYFNANNICQLNINGESITASNLLNGENSKKALNSYYMKIFDENKFFPAWIGIISNLESSIKNIEISFNYKNTINEITTYINIDGLNKTKIFRPSKYEKNVVFNQAGLNEMIDYFKKYPVIGITQSEKYGHIRISHGNPENNIDIAPYGFEAGTEDELLCSVDFLPSEHATYSIGKNGKDDIIYDATKNYYKFEDNQLTVMHYSDGMFFAGESITDNIINVSFNGLGTITTRSVFVNSNQELQIIQFGELASDSFRIEDYQLEVLDLTTNSLLTEEDIESEYIDTTVLITFLNYEFNHEYQLSLTVPNQRAGSNQTKETIISFLDLNDLVEEEQHQNPPLKWKNLFLSDTIQSENGIFNKQLKAKEIIVKDNIQGKFVGTPSGQSININDNFIVNASGDVQLKGNITWGNNDPIKCVYHRPINENNIDRPNQPVNNRISFEEESSTDWHTIVHANDFWASMSYNGGKTWSAPIRINAVDGKKGDDGAWDANSIIQALKLAEANGSVQGLMSFDNGTKIGLSAEAILAKLASFGRIEMDAGLDYEENNDNSLQGGYINFKVPTPFSTTETILNTKGWIGRLGYLRGNGDGHTATAGLGLVLHTTATWEDKYNTNGNNNSNATVGLKIGAQTVQTYIGDKLHLVLSTLMFTQSGLGLMFAANTTAGSDSSGRTWLDNDLLPSNEYHYTYKYTSGVTPTWVTLDNCKKYWRLWINVDNGRLYYTNPYENNKVHLWTSE